MNLRRIVQLFIVKGMPLWFIVALLSLPSLVQAGQEPYVNEIRGAKVKVDSSFTVSDEKFNSFSAGQWGGILRQSVDDILTFEINLDTSIYFFNTPFNCTASFKIYIYGNQADTSEITDSTTHANITLNVTYTNTDGSKYKAIALYKFKGAYKFKVKILSISCPQLNPIPAIFRVKGQVIVNRQYPFVDNSTDVTQFTILDSSRLRLDWSPSLYPGAEMVDLEYTYIDSSSQIGASLRNYRFNTVDFNPPADSLNKWFTNNSSRITTSASSYLLNIPYDSGYILFRIRGVQITSDNNIRYEGNWNYLARRSSDAECSGSACATGVVAFKGHQPSLNWQYSVVFAEEGKRKEVISYFDGSLRNRQSVTLSNSDNKNVVQETIYDALGRPAMNILPAPTMDSTLHYFKNFNRNPSGNPYSFNDLDYSGCATTALKLDTSSGSGSYYSRGNDFFAIPTKYYNARYIPDAEGSPFTVTEYMADNTGRIKAQGGVGDTFQLHRDHATKYYYYKPKQKELDRLFGAEVGDFSHYLKNMVRDANGQLSVSYMDAAGKTIATALAGESPASLQSLPSQTGAMVTITDDLIQPGDFRRNPGDNSLTASTSFAAVIKSDFIFNYRLDPLKYEKLYGINKDTLICSSCYYDLEVRIMDDCNNVIDSVVVSAGAIFDTSCVSLDTLEGTLTAEELEIGEYYVSYTLRISEDAMKYFDSVHLVKNSDIKKINYFLLEELKETDFYGCYSNCQTCFDQLGTKEEFLANFKLLYVSDSLEFSTEDSLWVDDLYDSLYLNCQNIQSECGNSVCDEKLELLKRDVSPGGQYALHDTSNVLLEYPINRLKAFYRNQIVSFPDEFGNPDSVMLKTVDGEDSIKVPVKELSDSMFIAHWKDSWADSLVKYHPEYCFYLWCLANSASAEFDAEIENWIDADTAIAKGWFNPNSYYALLDKDPFFTSISGGPGKGVAFYAKMKKDLRLYSRKWMGLAVKDKNILQYIDVLLYCKDQSNAWNACNPDSACRSRNREWEMYKRLYLNLKQKYNEEARRKDSAFANCVNCYIGKDLLQVGGIDCVPPPISDFELGDRYIAPDVCEASGIYVKYIGIVPLKDTVVVTITGRYNTGSGIDTIISTGLYPPGADRIGILMNCSVPGDSIWLTSISCKPRDTSFVPFVDSLTCTFNCPGGIYNPYDKDSVSLYIQYGNPNNPPSGAPSGYGNCRFYPIFDLQKTADSSCRFLNVWVCTYDSTCTTSFTCPTASNFTTSFTTPLCDGGTKLSAYIRYSGPMIPPGVTVSVSLNYNGCSIQWNSPSVHFTNTSDSTIYLCTPYSVTCGSVTKTVNTPSCTGTPTSTGNCSVGSYPSSCPPTVGDDTLYLTKQRRYPEYVNEDELMESIMNGNPQQLAEASIESVLNECASSCEAKADYWISVLRRCSIIESEMDELRAALIEICSKGCSITNPNGTSSIPANISATYHSFEEAIDAIIPGAINDSCTSELLSNPYPHDRLPVLVQRVIFETDYSICQKIGAMRNEWLASGFTGSWHQYLTNNYGAAYGLDSVDLDDLYKSCTQCNGILNNDIMLPIIFDPQSKPCLKCDSVQTALIAFNAKFDGIDTLSDDYEIIFSNYFNHRFGFSLRYDDYRNFLDSCVAHSGAYNFKLCNQPMVEEQGYPDFNCPTQLFVTALTNASSRYIVYIDSVRRDFREAWLTRCMNAQPKLEMEADLFEYHYTLYYYDQSGNLVKTVPPEGVQLLHDTMIAKVQEARKYGQNGYTVALNSMRFDGVGGIYYPSSNVNTGANPFAVEFYIKLDNYDRTILISNNNPEWTAFGIEYRKGFSVEINEEQLLLSLSEGLTNYEEGNLIAFTNASFIGLNKWSHVIVERENLTGDVKMFIDGNEVPVGYARRTLVSGDITPHPGGYIHLGNMFSGSGSLNGNLRQVRVYNRLLSRSEIIQNAFAINNNPANEIGLLYWQSFNEGIWKDHYANESVNEKINAFTGINSNVDNINWEIDITPVVPEHKLVTTYHYNSLNQVLQQYSPDGDTSVFFYDRLGRLIASQNKEQKENSSYSGSAGRFSYTDYDDLGRISLVAEKSGATDIRTIDLLNDATVDTWIGSGTNKQITKTLYDDPINIYQSTGTSRKRVVASIYLENSNDASGDSTLYAYDILGNVKTLVQHIKALVAVDATNGKKQIDYDYDLVSGKVNKVSYQAGKGDQFFYKYQYDADNRVIRSYTSRDQQLWIEDASYQYYLHGPLSRIELGQWKVQGLDYAYTLQGWLKGVNSMALSYDIDMGQDANPYGSTGNQRVSLDVNSFMLDYYKDDYKPIGQHLLGTAYTPFPGPQSQSAIDAKPLYNGNISGMGVNLFKLYTPVYNNYQYDQLNRIVAMDNFQGFNNIANHWNSLAIREDYKERISYDANGNILKYLRQGVNDWRGKDMDSLSYKYNANKNQLNYVKDAIGTTPYYDDISSQSTNNYTYDLIGNLKTDVSEGLTGIDWTVYGKIKQVTKSSTTIGYSYDPTGNRTFKTVTTGGVTTQTFYVRDAQGNTLAVYSKTGSNDLYWNEQHLYGSSRVGIWNWDTVVPATAPVVQSDNTPVYDSLIVGKRIYELSNHLGNVLTSISDKKIGITWNGTTVAYYLAEVITHNDYYPFGMLQPGRSYSVGNDYRYGFNGKENDNEVKGTGNQQDYGMRVYDPRLGKFLSVDPLARQYPSWSPYPFAMNRPIDGIDLDGLEWAPYDANGNKLDIKQNGWQDKATEYKWQGYDISYKVKMDKNKSKTFKSEEELNKAGYKYTDGKNGVQKSYKPKAGTVENGIVASLNVENSVSLNSTVYSVDAQHNPQQYSFSSTDKYMISAWMHQGVTEGGNPLIQTWIDQLNSDFGKTGKEKPIYNDKGPWCGVFVYTMLKESGVPVTGGGGITPAASWFFNNYWAEGVILKSPRMGAIARMNYSHVAFVMGFDETYVWILGGNQQPEPGFEDGRGTTVNIRRKLHSEVQNYVAPSKNW